jgi:hypothetical protein
MAEMISPKKAPFFREAREKCFINADKKKSEKNWD